MFMASAYDDIKRALALLRQGQPISEQTRTELNRVRKSIEQHLITAELSQNELPPGILDAMSVKDSLARPGQSAES